MKKNIFSAVVAALILCFSNYGDTEYALVNKESLSENKTSFINDFTKQSEIHSKAGLYDLTNDDLSNNHGWIGHLGGGKEGLDDTIHDDEDIKDFVNLNLKYFNDNEDLETVDDFSYQPNIIENEGIIRGTIKNHQEEFKRRYDVESLADIDWFRFSITERFNYAFSFKAPNDSYVFTLHKFSVLRGWSKGHERAFYDPEVEHTTIYSSSSKDARYECVLQPGTYFIRVKVETEEDVEENESYSLTFTKNFNFLNHEITQFELTEENINNYPVVVWENDNTPNPSLRWQNVDNICSYYDFNNCLYVDYGCVDPIYLADKEYTPHKFLELQPDENVYLDSVMYVCNIESIRELSKIVNDARLLFDSIQIHEKIESITMERNKKKDTIVNGVLQYGFKILSTSSGHLGSIMDWGSISISSLEAARAFNELIQFDINYDWYMPTSSQIANNLEMLRQNCLSILREYERYHVQNRVIKIPRYSYLTEYFDQYQTTIARFSSCLLHGIYSDDHFIAEKDTILKRRFVDSFSTVALQETDVMNYYENKMFSGTITTYDSFEKFNKYTNFDHIFLDYDIILDYKIVIEDNDYCLKVTNKTDIGHLITFNTHSASQLEASFFNLKADGYLSQDVMPRETRTIPLDGRNYIYVRENWKDYVFKISYVDNPAITATHISKPIYFGMNFLKISLVKIDGKTLTVRIRNLSTENLDVYYNRKLCFSWDAENWTNLQHINRKPKEILYNNYVDVKIDENWYASFVTVSYIKNGKRYISYGALQKRQAISYGMNIVEAV